MKLLCFKNRILLIFLLLQTFLFAFSPKSAVVYYGDSHPYEMLGAFDIVVLEPGNTDVSSYGFKTYKDKIFAYVSVMEIEKNRSYYKKIKKRWIKSKNALWKSLILDISNREYRNFLINRVLRDLYKKGYKNFFFDTVDSYHIFAKKKKDKKKYEKALIAFFKTVKKRYPRSKIIVNRGFEIIDEIYPFIDGVLFESLFYGLSSKDLSYKKVSKEDREWLLSWVKKIKKYGLFVISLDYLPENKMNTAKEIAKKIESFGIIPYVAQKKLNTVGVSSIDVLKREILILYNSDKLEYSKAFQSSIVLEYMGYIPKFFNPDKEPFLDSFSDRYKGVIVWLERKSSKEKAIKRALKRAVLDGSRVVFMENFGFSFDKSDLKFFSLKAYEDEGEFNVLSKDKMIGFEIPPKIPSEGFFFELTEGESLFSVKKHFSKNIYDLAAITRWGGYFQGEVLIPSIDGKDRLWSVNPFIFFKKALKLDDFPVPSVYTKNGKRVLLITVKCQGFNDKVEFDPKTKAYEMLFKEIFSKYKVSHSVCVKKRRFAKKIKRLSYIKTFYKMPLKSSLTSINNNSPWLCKIYPMGIVKNDGYEIFEPIGDENLYTGWWREPFWGYEKVIETFKLTEKPRRLKPIHINYHYYLATKKASLKSLKKVYEYAISMKYEPIFVNEYINRALNFYNIAIVNEKDGFKISGMRDLKSFRYKNCYSEGKKDSFYVRR